jgi:hypothetical protein
VIKALTGWGEVVGREYGSPTNQRVITGSPETGSSEAPGSR